MMAVPDGWDVGCSRLIQPKVEAEIAFVIGRDLDSNRLTIADIIRAIEFALPVIEIVDSRIADNASSAFTFSAAVRKNSTDSNFASLAW